MKNPLSELRNLLGTEMPPARVGRVLDYQVATGVLRVAVGGRELVARDAGSWAAGDQVILGADGRVLGRAPPVRGVVYAD